MIGGERVLEKKRRRENRIKRTEKFSINQDKVQIHNKRNNCAIVCLDV